MLKWIKPLKQFKKDIPPVPPAVFQRPLYFIAFGFGMGAIPFAPGTFGTLFAAFLYALLPDLSLWPRFAITLIVTLLSIYICDKVSKEIQCHDHPGMCLDEFPGFFTAMLFAPQTAIGIISAFLLFRFFDIIKPWPINWIDKHVHGGFGMVLDDVMAGVFTTVIFLLA